MRFVALGAAALAAFALLRLTGSSAPKIQHVATRQKFLPRVKLIRGIVIHHTHTATPSATVRVLEKRGFSTNYEVGPDGQIYVYADPSQWEAQATGGGANAHTIAVDVTHVGTSAPFPAVQIQSLRRLCAELAKRYGFTLRLAPDEGPRTWRGWQTIGAASSSALPTLWRHRNFAATGCPANLPMVDLV